MNALIVGFGAIGCRHAQSLLSSGRYGAIHVVEPSDQKFQEGLTRIGASRDDLVRCRGLDGVKEKVDVAIVATSSGPRYEIMTRLIPIGIPYFLVEKIVFQSIAQFDQILSLLHGTGIRAYCNFTNRYFTNYGELRKTLAGRKRPLSMTVAGGDLGLGSNAIHYMDLFEYLTGKPILLSGSNLSLWARENKRGPSYREFSGYVAARTADNDLLQIYFDPSHQGGVVLTFNFDNQTVLISEGSGVEVRSTIRKIERRAFTVIPTSRLTDRIIEDMVNNTCPLSTIAETRNAHMHLFIQVRRALNLNDKEDSLCPIT